MPSTFWPNRILERQSFQNRHAGLKFSSKWENSAPSMKIVQNALFRSSAALFGQIAVFSVKVLKIVTLTWNSRQNGKTVHFPWKLNKNALFRSCAARFGQILFFSVKFSKSSHWPEIPAKTGKQCAFHQNCTKRSFQVMRSTFWPNRIFERKVFKIVKLASNFLQSGKTVRFSWKLYNTLFSGRAQQVLAKSHFGAWKFSKSSRGPEILSKTRKQCAFYENCTKRSF